MGDIFMKKINSELIRYKWDGPLDEICGVYSIPHPTVKNYFIRVIASDGMGFDHVSVTLNDQSHGTKVVKRTPTWGEMSWVKDLFFDPDEWVIQYHPAHSEYVNNHQYCLHLWRPHVEFPKPSVEMVGSDVAGKPNYVI